MGYNIPTVSSKVLEEYQFTQAINPIISKNTYGQSLSYKKVYQAHPTNIEPMPQRKIPFVINEKT